MTERINEQSTPGAMSMVLSLPPPKAAFMISAFDVLVMTATSSFFSFVMEMVRPIISATIAEKKKM